jgi:hypothetical protein
MPSFRHVSTFCRSSSSDELFLACLVIVVTAIHPIARAGFMSGRYRSMYRFALHAAAPDIRAGRPAWATTVVFVVAC